MTEAGRQTPLRAIVGRWPTMLGVILLAFLASGILGTLFALLATGIARMIVTLIGTVSDVAATAIVALGALLIVVGISIPLLMGWAAVAALATSPGSRRRSFRMLMGASARVPALLGATVPLALITIVGVAVSLVLLPFVLVAVPLWLIVVLLRRRVSVRTLSIVTRVAVGLTPFGALAYWLVSWSQWLPRVALRREGPLEALRHSAAAVRPRWIRTARQQGFAVLIGLAVILASYGLLIAATLAGVDSIILGIAGGLLMFAATLIGGAVPVIVAARDLAKDGLSPSVPPAATPNRGVVAATALVMAPILIVTTLVLPGTAGIAHAAPGPTTLVVTSLTDAAEPGPEECAHGATCTLRGALSMLSAEGVGGTVRFAASGTISLVAPLIVTVPVLIDGEQNEVTISGGDATALLYLNAENGPAMTAGLRNITMANGSQSDTNAGAAFSFWMRNGSSAIVEGVTFLSNVSSGPGAAIYSQGAVQIVNSTFDGNHSTGDYYSSAVYHDSDQPMTIVNSTVHGGGGIVGYPNQPPITVHNSIVLVGAGYWSCSNVSGTGNLANAGAETCGTNAVTTADAGLAAPGSNGGPTQTIALQPGSPAIGAGLAEHCPAVDQRGVARHGTLGCDAGSYQRDDTTITRMSASHAIAQYSETVTINVSVATPGSPGTPTGTVTLSGYGSTLEADLDGSATARFTLPSLELGGYTIEADYTPQSDSTLTSSRSQLALQIVAAVSTVSLTINPGGDAASTPLGDDLTLRAHVRTQVTDLPVPGTVTFLDGDTVLGTALAADGAASLLVPGLAAGPHGITAHYDGESRFAAATSNSADHNVLAPSTTTLNITPNPAPWSSTSEVTVLVTGPLDGRTPTGTVNITVGDRAAGVTLDSNGHGTTSFSADAVGTHNAYASYGGDSYHAGSSADGTVVVEEAYTTTTLSLDRTELPYGTSVRATAVVEPQHAGVRTPTGDVRFFGVDGLVLGSAALVDGVAILDTDGTGPAALTPGTYPVRALYLPDNGLVGSADVSDDITVTTAVTATTIELAAGTAVFGEPVVATVTVETADGAPVREGTVTLRTENTFMSLALPGITTFDASTAGTAYASAVVVDGKATIVIDALAVSAHDVIAVYNSSTGYEDSISASVPLTITKASSTLTATIAETTAFGESVTVSALVEPVAPSQAIPTGQVELRDAVTGLLWGTATLDGAGSATLTLPRLEPGTRSATLTFASTATHEAASASASITVERAIAAVTLALESPDWEYGSPHLATVAVAGLSDVPPTGAINLKSSGVTVATGALVDGIAVIDVSSLEVGDRPLTAFYGGDNRYRPADSVVAIATVKRVSAVVAISSSENPSPRTTPLTFTVTVTTDAPAVIPTGNVRILADTTELAIVTLDGGTASVTGVHLPPGAHQITAEYAGDAFTAPNISAALGQVIAPVAPVLTLSTSPANPVYGDEFDIIVTATDPLTDNGIPNMWIRAQGYGTQLTSSSGVARFTVDQSVYHIEPGDKTVPVTAYATGVHSETSVDLDYTVLKAPMMLQVDTSGATTAHQAGIVNVYLAIRPIDGIAPFNGRVTLYKDGETISGGYTPSFVISGGVASGIVQLPHTPDSAGSFQLWAEYAGDHYYSGTSDTRTHTVRQAPTRLDVDLRRVEGSFGDTVPIEFDVIQELPPGHTPTGPAPTGTVTVTDGHGILCSVDLPATGCAIGLRDVGIQSFLVSYSGDDDFASSVAVTSKITVAAAVTSITASVASPAPQTTRDTTSLQWSIDRDLDVFPDARVIASLDGGAVLCDEPASADGCSFQLTEAQRGTRTITLKYTPGRYGYATATHTLWGVAVKGCYTVGLPVLELSTVSQAPSCGAGTGYLDGTALTVTADLDEGVEVLEWRRDGEPREAPSPAITIRITADTVLEVYTTATCVTLKLPTSYLRNAHHEPGTGGFLLPLTNPNCRQSPEQAEAEIWEGSVRYAYGTTVSVRAFPASGTSQAAANILYEWSDGHARGELIRPVTLTEDRTIDATFGQTCYAGPVVTAGQGGSAAVVGSAFRSSAWFTEEYEGLQGRCSSPLGDGYVLGTQVTLEAAPASLRNRDGSWSADDASYYVEEWRHNVGVSPRLTSAPLAVTVLGESSRYQPVRATVTVKTVPTYSHAVFAHVQCYRLNVGVSDAVDASLLYEGTTVPTITRSDDSSCSARGDGWYAPGTKVTLTPQSQGSRQAYFFDEGARDYLRTPIVFGGWSGDLTLPYDRSLTSYSPTVTVDRDLAVTAYWVLASNACMPVALHTQPANTGTVSAVGYHEGCRPGSFHRNSSVKISAKPPGDYLTIWHVRSELTSHESAYTPGQNEFEYRASTPAVATAWFCGRATPSVSVRGLDGKLRPVSSDAVSPFFEYTRDGMCPIDGFYLPGSTASFSLSDIASVPYELLDFTVNGKKLTSSAATVSFANGVAANTIQMNVEAKCSELTVVSSGGVTRSLEPNCPGAPGAIGSGSTWTGWYLEGSELTLFAHDRTHYDFTGWSGAATTSDSVVHVAIDGNTTVRASYSEHDLLEKAYDIVVAPAVNAIGVVAKKSIAYISAAVEGIAMSYASFLTISSLVLHGLDQLLMEIGVEGGIGDDMKSVLRVMDDTVSFMTAFTRCAAEWSHGGGGNNTEHLAKGVTASKKLLNLAETGLNSGWQQFQATKSGLTVVASTAFTIANTIDNPPVWESSAADAWSTGGDAFTECVAGKTSGLLGLAR